MSKLTGTRLLLAAGKALVASVLGKRADSLSHLIVEEPRDPIKGEPFGAIASLELIGILLCICRRDAIWRGKVASAVLGGFMDSCEMPSLSTR